MDSTLVSLSLRFSGSSLLITSSWGGKRTRCISKSTRSTLCSNSSTHLEVDHIYPNFKMLLLLIFLSFFFYHLWVRVLSKEVWFGRKCRVWEWQRVMEAQFGGRKVLGKKGKCRVWDWWVHNQWCPVENEGTKTFWSRSPYATVHFGKQKLCVSTKWCCAFYLVLLCILYVISPRLKSFSNSKTFFPKLRLHQSPNSSETHLLFYWVFSTISCLTYLKVSLVRPFTFAWLISMSIIAKF